MVVGIFSPAWLWQTEGRDRKTGRKPTGQLA